MYLIAVPVIAVVGLLIVALAAHSWTGFVWLLILTALFTALLAAAEVFQAPAAWQNDSPMKPMAGWMGLVLFLWPLGYPAYLRGRRRYQLGNWLFAALVSEAVFLAGVVLAILITASGYGKAPAASAQADQAMKLMTADPRWVPDPGDLQLVKTAHLDNCPSKTFEQEVNGYLEAPHWQAGASADGTDFVNVSGLLNYQGKTATAVFQFVIYKDKSGFRYQAFEINDVAQPLYIAGLTLQQMCQ